MKNVSVSELKSRLSQYLREVRRGGEVQVLDRGVPIARISPLPPSADTSDESHRQHLIQAGILRCGHGGVPKFLETPPLELPARLTEALDEERRDRL